jgi:hypothetical protein
MGPSVRVVSIAPINLVALERIADDVKTAGLELDQLVNGLDVQLWRKREYHSGATVGDHLRALQSSGRHLFQSVKCGGLPDVPPGPERLVAHGRLAERPAVTLRCWRKVRHAVDIELDRTLRADSALPPSSVEAVAALAASYLVEIRTRVDAIRRHVA